MSNLISNLTPTSLANIKFNSRDFKGLHGLEFDELSSLTELTRVAEWEVELYEDTDGNFLRFSLIGAFKDESGSFQEPFVLWVDVNGKATITDIKMQLSDKKLDDSDVEPLLLKLDLR